MNNNINPYRSKILFFIALLLAVLSLPVLAQEKQPVLLMNVEGAIGPATSDYIQRGIQMAADQSAGLVIIRLDTPGGLDTSMRAIIKAIISSPVPVATYVAPSGARAASAGTFLLYASHIAAMAPGTNLGAASPVSIGGDLPSPTPESPIDSPDEKDDGETAPAGQTTLEKKVTQDAAAYIRSLAQLRGRNVEFAEEAVEEAATLTAQEALARNVIDLIAININDLTTQTNGREVDVRGEMITLETENAPIIEFNPDWRVKLLAIITNPSIAYVLLLIGIYGLFFEFANPGFVAPGVIGAIALILALYALHMLPISYAGLGLIILGIIFMVAEAFMPSFGALGMGGIIAFIIGSIMLMDIGVPGYAIAWQVIAAMAIVNALFFFVVISMAVRSHRRKPTSGAEHLIGLTGYTMEEIDRFGQAKVQGEIWNVESKQPLPRNTPIRVIRIKGLTLTVEPLVNKKNQE